MATVCVFTPTFNRAYILPKLYESLVAQTSRDFSWLIVDDGSTDNTAELVHGWQAEGLVPITYIYQENGGKQRATNTGQDSRCHEHAGLGLRATGERLFLRERGFGDVRAQVGFQRNRVGGRRHIVGGDFLDLVDGVCDDVQFALQTGDFLIGERDSGQIAQMHDFFA